MKYMGSKRRIADDILRLILKDRKPGQTYVEPFCGGCNTLDKVLNPRLANDLNPYLIALFKEMQVQVPFNPPKFAEADYKPMRDNKGLYPAWQVGYVGFNLTYAGRFFEGWARGAGRDYDAEARRNLSKQQPLLQGVEFVCGDYADLQVPDHSVIYCDSPYKGAKEYKNSGFDHDRFYAWCRSMSNAGHQVFISEYSMPDDFECIWRREVVSSLTADTGAKRAVEKLFTLRGQHGHL